MVLNWRRERFSASRSASKPPQLLPAGLREGSGGRFPQQAASLIFFLRLKFLPMPTSPASACPRRERRPFKLSLALSAITKSALKESSNQTLSWLGCVKFPELENGRRNTWPCERSENPIRFQPVTSVFCARRIWAALASWNDVLRRGDPGEHTRPCISGLFLAAGLRKANAFILSSPRRPPKKLHLAGMHQ